MTLEIIKNNSEIARKVKYAINKRVFEKEALKFKLDRLANALANFIFEKFKQTDTFHSLVGGDLRAEFGLDDYEVSHLPYNLNQILNVDIEYHKLGNSVSIFIGFVKKEIDFDTYGMYFSETKTAKYAITWLKWLLTAGENVVVSDYAVYLKQGRGRSEMAIMIKPESGGSYSVDGLYSGTENDNWITRTLNQNKEQLSKIIKDTLSNGP